LSSASFAAVRLTADFPLAIGELDALTADGDSVISGEIAMVKNIATDDCVARKVRNELAVTLNSF
jgi:hypothetical protein